MVCQRHEQQDGHWTLGMFVSKVHTIPASMACIICFMSAGMLSRWWWYPELKNPSFQLPSRAKPLKDPSIPGVRPQEVEAL